MPKTRVTIPKQVQEGVLREYNHRCAICGADRPQIHHIDEDPSNNVPKNLLPLCPNCHLTDQHDPTRRIATGKLQLFRRYKDPTVLSPQFHPLFNRLQFLSGIEVDDSPTSSLEEQADELVEFVNVLEMGSFYAKEIRKLTKPPVRVSVFVLGDGPDPESERRFRRENREYRAQLADVRERVVELVIELLRYQPWPQRPS